MASSESEIKAEIARLARQGDHREIREANLNFAEQAAGFAKSIAPVRTGAYRDSIHVETRPNVDGLPASQLVADVDYANLIEYGSKNNPPSAVFGQTAAHFGGDQQGPQ